MIVKMAVLKEQIQQQSGIPQRTNVKKETVDLKLMIADFMKQAGWLPLMD